MFLNFATDMPHVMGILNITHDSFSDGGLYLDASKALRHAIAMIEDGASIIDIGGESTRPGAEPVGTQEELDRVIPVIECLRQENDVLISIDTTKPTVMKEAVRAGANMINDVNALEAEGAIEVAASYEVDICLMHKQGSPKTMQVAPTYAEVVDDVCTYLTRRVQACLNGGIKLERLCIDPGFGFGKSVPHNLKLINHLRDFSTLKCPILIGVSRKSTIGTLLDADEANRLAGSLSMSVIAYLNGARIFRAHDVKETADALKVAQAVCKSD